MAKKKSKNPVYDSVNPVYSHKKEKLKTAPEYIDEIRCGNRTLLSQAITLVESSKEEHQQLAQEIIQGCLPYAAQSVRVGITGVPGVGKSTFIEALGKRIIEEGKKLAVLTIDPSSAISKGSILGDKTRMPHLSSNKHAFIRPSPASGSLGGVARKTRETIILCEAAGFDTIFVETVGVGQSEISAKSMVDVFVLLMLAGAGDELQGIKRGIMEMADIIAINKADGKNITNTKNAKQEIENAIHLLPPPPSGYSVPVLTCSALDGAGIADVKNELERFISAVKESGYYRNNRREQSVFWMRQTVENRLKEQFYSNPNVKKKILQKETAVREGTISPFKAALDLLEMNRT